MQSLIISFGKRIFNKSATFWTRGFETSLTGRFISFLHTSYHNSYIGWLFNHNMTEQSRTFALLRSMTGALERHLSWPAALRARQQKLVYAALLVLATLTILSFIWLPYTQAFVILAAALLTIATFYRTEYGLYAAALLLPFLPLKGLLALSLLTLISLLFKKAQKANFRFYLSSLFIPILAFFAVMFYATVTSISFWESAGEFVIPITGLIYLFVIVNTIDNQEKMINLLGCLALAGLVTAAYAIYQFYNGVNVMELKKEWVDITQNPDLKNRAYAVFENPNTLAQYMILLTSLSLGAAFAVKKVGLQVFFAATAAVAIFCLVLTYSRGGWLSLAIALLVLALFKSKLLVQLLALAGILLYTVLPASITNRLSTITSLQDTSNLYRLDTWNSTIALIRDYWETGVGLGRRVFARVYHNHMINSTVVPHSHNLYLQTISEFGILGLAVFCWLFISILRIGIKLSAATNTVIKNLNAGIMAALAGFLAHSVVDYFLWYYKLGILLWLLIAILLVLEKITAQEIGPERKEQNV